MGVSNDSAEKWTFTKILYHLSDSQHQGNYIIHNPYNSLKASNSSLKASKGCFSTPYPELAYKLLGTRYNRAWRE